jgi:hypothetical protein
MGTRKNDNEERDALRAKRGELHGRKLLQARPEFSMGGWVPSPYVGGPGVWEFWMPMSTPQSEMIRLINEWEANKILDRSTLFFGVEMIFQNHQVSHGIVSHVFFEFLFSRGGYIYSDVKLVSMVLDDSKLVILWATIWIGMLIFNTVVIPGRACSAKGKRKLVTHMTRKINVLEWTLMICGWVIVVAFMIERWGIRKFNKQVTDYKDARVAITGASDTLTTQLKNDLDIDWQVKINRNLYLAGVVDSAVQTLVAWYHLALMLRFFVASNGQPRLAIVVNTIKEATVDLIHLFFVFGIIFLAYVVSGYILFGRRLARLSTLEGSLAYTVQIVLMREFNFQELTYQDFWTVCLWVYTFVILVVLVLVNIVLAMIFDTYGEVRGQVTEGDSLVNTFVRVFNQAKYAQVWVNNRNLLIATKKLGTASITVNQLKSVLPGISTVQMTYLFDRAKSRVEAMMTKGNKNALPEAIASVLIGIAQLKDGVAEMRTGIKRNGKDKSKDTSSAGIPDVDDDSAFVNDESGQPKWLKDGFLPFLKKQSTFLDQAQNEIDQVATQLNTRGIGAGINKSTMPRPTKPWDEGPLIYPWGDAKLSSMDEERTNFVAGPTPPSEVPASMGKSRYSVGS